MRLQSREEQPCTHTIHQQQHTVQWRDKSAEDHTLPQYLILCLLGDRRELPGVGSLVQLVVKAWLHGEEHHRAQLHTEIQVHISYYRYWHRNV